MTQYLIGAGGWAYFQVPKMHPLVAYSKAFNFVEINSTFYEIPSLKLVESWRRMVPSTFQFSVRCNNALTHKYKFQPTLETYNIFKKMISICRILKTEILHMQTPSTFQNFDLMNNFFSAINLKGIKIALEIRGGGSLTPKIVKIMQNYNMIHCIDLSKDEEPAYKSDILYSRLFGKGYHNIYQPTDLELKEIDQKVIKEEPKIAVINFHFTKMYKDAARFKIFKKTEKFPMVTKSTGIHSLEEILKEDARFPSNKQHLIDHQGWKLVDATVDKRVYASDLLQRLPEKTYNSITEVIKMLKSTV